MLLCNLQNNVTEIYLYITRLLCSETRNSLISENGYFDKKYGENTKLCVESDRALKILDLEIININRSQNSVVSVKVSFCKTQNNREAVVRRGF